MQPNADLARTLCATTGDSAGRPSRTEAAGVAACQGTGKLMPEPNQMDGRTWTERNLGGRLNKTAFYLAGWSRKLSDRRFGIDLRVQESFGSL